MLNIRLSFWTFALLAAIALFAPLRHGDLPGYDDAHYAEMAKEMVLSGDWTNTQSNGYPALEHPPLLLWIQAALFQVFGFSDAAARLPSAVCGLAVILLVYWLARRLLGEPLKALTAMAVMMASIYFLKYAGRAMTDVPFTCFFLCAICAWVLGEQHPAWYLGAGVFTCCALLTRGFTGFALPAIFGLDLWVQRKRAPVSHLAAAAGIAFIPLAAWYVHWLVLYGGGFFPAYERWLNQEVTGDLSPPWRRYTGAFEYAFMLAKSYWPWLPFLLVGLVFVIRQRRRELLVLAIWPAVMFALCSITKSRVLRYMLPAYPAFAILAAIGLFRVFPERCIAFGLRILAPVFAAAALAIALFIPARPHAAEIVPIARVASQATPPGSRFGFYDEGLPRYDEVNQLLWYGNRYLDLFENPRRLPAAFDRPRPYVLVLDRGTYESHIGSKRRSEVLAESGHLICIRLLPG